MKIKHLLIGMLAVAAAVACKQDEPVETPKLDVDKEAVAVAAVAGEASFNVTSNQSWVASADQDWVSINPASGDASEKAVAVKVTAEDNETTDARIATVTVKAGELTKTVKVTQAPGEGQEPGGDPLPNSEWALVGSFNGWDPTSTTYLCILDDQYFVYYGFELDATTEFKFLKGGSWSGTEIGGNGLVEPNTIQPKGGSNIKVSEAGIYDIYLAADLEHFYIMSEGKTPEEATEPAPVDDQWGMMGCFVNNMWASDVPMTKEGEWIVAKGAEFTELTFKIRANSSWADATNIGVAPGSERGVVNGKIAVVTAEYAKANLGGDAADIKLNGEPGTYDVYFSFENLEVYVMEQGFKPGEKDPQNPDPVEVTYTVVGTIENQNWNNSAPEGLMVAEGDYLVAKNVPFLMASTMYGGPEQFEFKIVETGTWTGYGRVEDVTNPVNAEVAVKLGGDNIMVAGTEGAYDVYFDKANAKVWVMAPGLKPGETPEPEPEYELDGKQWLLSASGMYVLVDLGLYEEDAMVIAIPLMDGSGFGAYMYGTYEIEKANNTSGKIVFTQYDPEWDEWMEPVDYAYSDLSDELVMINAEPITGYPDALPFVAVAEPYEILFESAGGDPVGPIENGQYWFFNGTKVMAPLAEGVTTGTFPAGNVIDGASTEKNIFTLMYDPDMSYYTIMDSYGRYVGHTDWESGNLTVTDVLPTGDDYAYYLWCVDNSYADGTCDIYNAATYFGFAYSATENCWYADENSYDTDGIRPTLVVAENPVEEPVEPAGPKVVTVAEFNAATDNTIEYQVSGTISGIYQAYNASYDNISIYISDETGEMLAYRLSCAGITDPANTLTKGDLITVKGMRTLYNENPQMAQGGVIVEHTDVVVEQPAGSAELSFADKANRTVFTTSQQVWEQNGIKLTNDKGSSTSNVADYAAPARFYKSSKLTVEYAGMTKIEFVCNNSSYATALQSSITTGTVSVSGSVVTVVLPAAADSYVISSLTGGQVRMDSLTVYAE
ncbi:MAG: SusF/SusE family outer membrane protein [Bacteroidales bacterium]|nr:SusF/SusE family outer membrane protein [Bacteroidales bacterium]